jgi:hypothetical protein
MGREGERTGGSSSEARVAGRDDESFGRIELTAREL